MEYYTIVSFDEEKNPILKKTDKLNFEKFIDKYINKKNIPDAPSHIKVYFKGLDKKYKNSGDKKLKLLWDYFGDKQFYVSCSPWTLNSKYQQMFNLDFVTMIDLLSKMEIK